MQSLQEEINSEDNCVKAIVQRTRNKFDQLAKLKNTYPVEELLKHFNLILLEEAIDILNVSMISLLLEINKIDLKQKEYNGLLVYLLKDPRYLLRGVFDIACLLLNAGASTKRPALHFAVENGHTLVVEELLKRGVDFNKIDQRRDKTPLMIAGKKGYYKIIKMLYNYGARDNILDGDGNNALTITIHSLDSTDSPISLENRPGHKKSIKLLCKYGSDQNIKPRSNQNLTPIESAKRYSHSTVVDLLEEIARNRKDK